MVPREVLWDPSWFEDNPRFANYDNFPEMDESEWHQGEILRPLNGFKVLFPRCGDYLPPELSPELRTCLKRRLRQLVGVYTPHWNDVEQKAGAYQEYDKVHVDFTRRRGRLLCLSCFNLTDHGKGQPVHQECPLCRSGVTVWRDEMQVERHFFKHESEAPGELAQFYYRGWQYWRKDIALWCALGMPRASKHRGDLLFFLRFLADLSWSRVSEEYSDWRVNAEIEQTQRRMMKRDLGYFDPEMEESGFMSYYSVAREKVLHGVSPLLRFPIPDATQGRIYAHWQQAYDQVCE